MPLYEHRLTPPVSFALFLRRLFTHFVVALLLVAGSLALGMLGYRRFEGLEWVDAFLNAAMLLGGMGPVESPHTFAGKVFAGVYALYAGLVFLAVTGVVLAPVLHRVLHRFHWENRERQ